MEIHWKFQVGEGSQNSKFLKGWGNSNQTALRGRGINFFLNNTCQQVDSLLFQSFQSLGTFQFVSEFQKCVEQKGKSIHAGLYMSCH